MSTKFNFTSQVAIRSEFWDQHPQFKRRPGFKQNQYPADVRLAFCDFVESLNRSGQISEDLTHRVTL